MASVKKSIKKAQVGDTLKKKYPTEERFTTKNYDVKKITYPGGDSKTETTFKPSTNFNIPSIKKKKGKSGTTIAKAKDGKWMQKAAASIKRRGTEGKCTPITKPGCTGKAKALAKTFKKIAAKRKGK